MAANSSLSVRDAADIFGISDLASINEIRSRYHELVKEWHPDLSQQAPEQHHEKMVRLNAAYSVLMAYCMQYRVSFRPEDMREDNGKGPSVSWMDQYGDDPIWGPCRTQPGKKSQ